MPQPKQYLTRNGTNMTLDQIIASAKSDGTQVFSDGDWVVHVAARKRAKPGTRSENTILTEEELNEIFGAGD